MNEVSLWAYRSLVAVPAGLCFLAQACSTLQSPINLSDYESDLIDGSAIFGEAVLISESNPIDPLELSEEMRRFVGGIVSVTPEIARYRRLINKLEKYGYFDESYDSNLTNSAAETFSTKKGNCLSYTNMFIALARFANLDARYQIVHMRFPSWDVQGRLLIRNSHINVFVSGRKAEYRPYAEYNPKSGNTVDFNLVDPDPAAATTRITDGFAASLFYANLAVKERIRGNDRVAFSYLRRAIEMAPQNPDLWVNLGAMYGRYGAHDKAIKSYRVAEGLDPGERAMLSGMERSLRAMGDLSEADTYERRVKRYRMSNPFYLFAMAEIAYQEGEFQESLASVDRAIKMEKRNPRFHFLKGLNLYRLSKKDEARIQFLKAQKLGRFDDLWLKYVAEQLDDKLAS